MSNKMPDGSFAVDNEQFEIVRSAKAPYIPMIKSKGGALPPEVNNKEFIIEAHYDPDLENFVLDTDTSDIIANIDLNTKLSIDDGEMVFPITCLEKHGTNKGSAAFGMAELTDSLYDNGSFIRGATPGAQIEWGPKYLPYGGGDNGGGETNLGAYIRVFDQRVVHHLNIVFEHDTDSTVSGALISPLDIEDIKYHIDHGAIFTAEMGGDYPYPLGTCILSSSGMGFMIRGIQDDQLQYDVWYDIDNECWKKYIPYMPQY